MAIMYAVTYCGAPAVPEALARVMRRCGKEIHILSDGTFIAAPIKRETVRWFEAVFDTSWKNRPPGVECERMIVAKNNRKNSSK